MTKTKAEDAPADEPGAAGAIADSGGGGAAAAPQAEPQTGIAAALAELREADEEAHVLWKTSGPRNSRVDEIAAILFSDGELRDVVIVVAYVSGKFKVFQEVTLATLFDPVPAPAQPPEAV